MTRHLCISVTFLDPFFHGRGDDEPEWPPSPLRLFQALLAGAHAGRHGRDWNAAKASAFRWLEGRQPPVIVAPAARLMRGYTLFVPNNDGDKVFARQERLTGKIVRPHHLSTGDTVHYLWMIEHGDSIGQAYAEAFCNEARHLLALGWGIDQVVGHGRVLTDAEASALAGERWYPSGGEPGGQTWRVPTTGSLDDLDAVHDSFRRRVRGRLYTPPRKLRQFAVSSYHRPRRDASTEAPVLQDGQLLALPRRACAVFEMSESVAFPQQDAAKVAAMLRSLANRSARQDTHEFPGGSGTYVAGHASGRETPPRFSYLPLPTIGHEHADGMIRRLIIAEPFGGDGAHARWAQGRLRGAVLQDREGNERGRLLDLWRGSSRTMIERFVGTARAWSTVTPVILPGFDDGKRNKAEKLLLAAVRQAGIPLDAVAELTMRQAPFWPGSQHPRQYFVPAYLQRLPGWHARLVFHEPLAGPVAIGGGRHVGLGLFAQTEM